MKVSTTTASSTPPSDGKSGSPSFYPSMDWEKRKKAIIEQTLAAMDPGSEEYRMASLYPSMNPEIQRRLADEKSRAEAKDTPQQAASRPMDLADKSNRSNNTLSPSSPLHQFFPAFNSRQNRSPQNQCLHLSLRNRQQTKH